MASWRGSDPGSSVPEPGRDWRALYEDAACALLLTDRHGRILQANRTLEGWLGVDAGALAGRRFQDLLSVGGRIFHQTHWAPLLQMQGSISEVKLDLLRVDGRPVPMVMNAVSRERDGEVVHELALFVAQDRHAYERELLQARRQAEGLLSVQKDRALFAEQMVGIVSHDLRSPLNALTLGVDLLSRSGPSREQSMVLENLGRSIRRARRLIDDLLDFTLARIGRGLKVQPVNLDAHGAIANHVRELALAHSGWRIVHACEGAGPARTDADRLFQVLSNLVANAVAYGERGTPITVTSRIDEDGLRICVHNHGTPIPEAARLRLFEPMVRGVDGDSSSRSVGLGLYIVAQIAQAHGGSVHVDSRPEQGTAFTVFFANEPAR
jgi:sigma-B regulation protein RsbU (phosphoserine phosphatase)